jgi:hypothetical protein
MDLEQFSNHYIFHRGVRLGNDHRPYLKKIFWAVFFARRTILSAARQMEKTTLLIKIIAYCSWKYAPMTSILILPRTQQIHRLIRSRLEPILGDSPALRKCLIFRKPIAMKHITFLNGSEIISDSAFRTSDAARGLSGGLLSIDEFQDVATDCIAVLEETQSHQQSPRTLLTGTAKLSDNQLEQAFWRGTANIWMTTCAACRFAQPADGEIIADDAYRCRKCQQPIDPHIGEWHPQNPGSMFGESFRLAQIFAPWTTFEQIKEKKMLYSHVQFRNEVLGESVTQGDLQLSLDDLGRCCTERKLIETYLAAPVELLAWPIVAGIDWGNTALATTSITVGILDANFIFHVLTWGRLQPGKDPKEILTFVTRICREMRVSAVAVDAQGNGSVFRPLLFDTLQSEIVTYGVSYTTELGFSVRSETPYRHLMNVGKVQAVSNVVYAVKTQRIQFPRRHDCESYLVEIASERCIPDEKGRGFRYERSPGQPDDAMHSLVYAVSAANHLRHGRPYF